MSETIKVAVGCDYETETPWVYTDVGDKTGEDYGNRWLVREIPASLAARFEAARKEMDDAIDVVHEAAGYDYREQRAKECCDDYVGEPRQSPIDSRRKWWEPCERCAWEHDDHQAAGGIDD